MRLSDTHCHLDFDLFDPDREEVLARAVKVGVQRMLVPGVDLESSRRAVEIAARYAPVYVAVGVHPNEAMGWQGDTREALRELAKEEKVVAVGEIGLDYYRERASRTMQMRVLEEQLELAAEANLPVVIHNRRATEDLLPLLERWQQGLRDLNSPLEARPGVLHSFDESIDVARSAIASRFMIGIGGAVTFHNAKRLQQTAAELETEWVLIETDAPFLTPHPYRGKRNEPAFVHLVAEKLAGLLGLPIDRVAEITSTNAERIFQW